MWKFVAWYIYFSCNITRVLVLSQFLHMWKLLKVVLMLLRAWLLSCPGLLESCCYVCAIVGWFVTKQTLTCCLHSLLL